MSNLALSLTFALSVVICLTYSFCLVVVVYAILRLAMNITDRVTETINNWIDKKYEYKKNKKD